MDLSSIYFESLLGREEELDEINAKIEGIKEEIKGKNLGKLEKRSKLEGLYLGIMNIQYQAAKLFNPMTQFGKYGLLAARASEQEYSEIAGPLTIRITSDNADKFKSLMSSDMLEDIKTEKLQAIGAIRYFKKALYAAGVLAYTIEPDRLMESKVLRIEWLYVATTFREQGVATTLLGSIIDKSIDAGVDHITADFPDESDFTFAFYNMFSDWHFGFMSGLSPEFTVRVTSEHNSEAVDKLSTLPTPIGGVPQLKELMDTISQGDAGLKNILARKHPDDYFDQNLSCFVYDKNKNGALLLAHRLPGGLVRCEYLGWTKKGENYTKALVCYIFKNAGKTYGDDTVISVPVESEELQAFLDKNFGEQLARQIIEASLSSFLSEEDIDMQDAVMILGHSNEENDEDNNEN